MKRLSIGLTGVGLVCAAALVQGSSVIPPGVPEPGLVIWGSVVNLTNPAQPVAIASVSWSVTDGTKTAVYSAGSRPATRIVSLGGRTHYIVEIPFDTRRFGTVTLADPATGGIDSFELRAASPPTYTLTPTINGALATVQAVDGAPSGGSALPVAGFTATTRGRVIRVDLAIIPPMDDYDAWAASIFGSASLPEAQRTADPDGDGLNNEGEFTAGTDPLDGDSVLRLLTVRVDTPQNKAVLHWQSVSGKSYRIEMASELKDVWVDVGQAVPGNDISTQAEVGLSPGLRRFYRIRVVP